MKVVDLHIEKNIFEISFHLHSKLNSNSFSQDPMYQISLPTNLAINFNQKHGSQKKLTSQMDPFNYIVVKKVGLGRLVVWDSYSRATPQ